MPRSVYTGRLREFPGLVFADQGVFESRGRWGEFFGGRIGGAFDGRIVVEIGCADAALLGGVAAKHPGTAFIGLDWKCKPLYDGARRIASLGLRNIALLRGRGQDIGRIFGEREIDEVWVFHPDPCDTEVERKNRLIASPFLRDLHGVLRDGSSTLTLKTDHREYHESALSLLARPAIRARFKLVMHSADFWRDRAAMSHTTGRCYAGERTAFENRFMRKGRPIYFAEVCKRM